MQKKSRHTNTPISLTAFVRRALLMLLLVVSSSAWGQITNVSTGSVDNQNYGWLMSTYITPQTLADIDSWTGEMISKSGEHWDGTTESLYYEQTLSDWLASSWTRSNNTTITLPKGKYLLMGAARASANVNAYMKVTCQGATRSIAMANKGNTGKGIDVNGIATSTDASATGTFSNNGNGGGWEYRYISFDVTADGTSVTIEVGGEANEKNKWMSFTTPQLRKSADDNTSMTSLNVTDASLFHSWSRPEPGAIDNGIASGGACSLNTSVDCVYGDGLVNYLKYADLSNYKTLELVVNDGSPRLLFNRVSDEGALTEINPNNENFTKYVTRYGNVWKVDLEKIRVNEGSYVHLNAIKANYGQTINIESLKLYSHPVELTTNNLFKEYESDLTTVRTENPTMDNHFGTEVENMGTIYGLPSGAINNDGFADLSGYSKMVIAYTGIPRLVFNQFASDNRLEIFPTSNYDYLSVENGLMTIDLDALRTANSGLSRLNSIKAWGGAATVFSVHLYTESEWEQLNYFPFCLGEAKSTATEEYGSKQIEQTATSANFNLSGSSLSGVKYARIYLADVSGNKLADQSALAVTYGGNAAVTVENANGYYVYDGGNNLTLANVTATVNGAAGSLDQYRIVCLLSTSAGTPAAGPLTQEPNWDLTYTYSFTYPLTEIIVPLNAADLVTKSLELKYHDAARNQLGHNQDSEVTSYYGRWYVRNKNTGLRQPLMFAGWNDDSDATNWAIKMFYQNNNFQPGNWDSGAVINNNAGEQGASSRDSWDTNFAGFFGNLKIYVPISVGTMMLDCTDYEIVFECTDDYSSGTPAMKLRYVFQFPTIGDFEGEANTGATESSSTQNVTRTAASNNVNVSTEAAGKKYARFYLTNAAGTAINPTGLLEVKYNGVDATACDVATSGYWIYNGGSDLNVNNITVTLKAPKAYKNYKVVALYSSALDNILYASPLMLEEPDYDLKHTYSFGYTVATYEQAIPLQWDATAMDVDASNADIDTNWDTTLGELTAGQCLKWWVENGSGVKQPLALGTERQSGTWTLGLGLPFEVDGNVASFYGMTAIDAGQLASWVTTHAYAPLGSTYTDVAGYKIVFELYSNNAGSGNPNARYTFTVHKGFVGSLKNGVTETKVRILLPSAGLSEYTFSALIPTGTRQSRFYLTDKDGKPIDYTNAAHTMDAQYTAAVDPSVEGYNISLGCYRYANDPIWFDAEEQIKLTVSGATLDQYQVVVVTSGDAAVFDGSVMTSEPDWDTKTTYWFKYPPAVKKKLEAHVEWSAQSMQITAPAIEDAGNLGTGYLENNKQHYTLQWYVQDDDGIWPLQARNERVNDWWTFSVNGDPFTVIDNKATVTSNEALSSANWQRWAAPVFYAPKNKTFRELNEKHTRIVCKFYEDDQSPLDEALCSFIDSIWIDHQVQLGELKNGGKRGSVILPVPSAETTSMTIDLTQATAAFAAEVGGTPRYARVYLAKNDGTPLDPTTDPEKLENVWGIPFNTKELGYYFINDGGITLSNNATVTLPASKFSFYNVVVALSGDAGEGGHTGAFARRKAASVAGIYEPDYDYIYTIKFAETSNFPGTVAANVFQHAKEVLVANESVPSVTMPLSEAITKIKTEYEQPNFSTLAANLHVRWYITKRSTSGEYVKIPGSENYLSASNAYWNHQTETDQGLYWNAVTSGVTPSDDDVSNLLDVTIQKPSASDSWEDYRVMIYMRYNKTENGGLTATGQYDDGGSPKKLLHEPDNLDMLYIYNFYVEDDDHFQFVHDKGASERDFITSANDSRISSTAQQYAWSNATGSKTAVAGDIRQGVHTVEYDIYVDPTSSAPISLKLPFQDYYGSGDVLEPTAYIRWYDWKTDLNNSRLIQVGSYLEEKHENNNGINVSRGFFMLNNSKNGIEPVENLVGVRLNPNGLTGTVTIACDVSKYYDGIYSGTLDDSRSDFSGLKKPYLMHEPTLSTRYLFNIHPATDIADAIKTGQLKLEAEGDDMFELAEDNGRVCAASTNSSTRFCVRANLSKLEDYYVYNGSALIQCSKITWESYYEDAHGKIWKKDLPVQSNLSVRITEIAYSELGGGYTSLDGSEYIANLTVQSGYRMHIVGSIGDGTTMVPTIHYEIIPIHAPAYTPGDLPLERTEAYLTEHMTLQSTVNFDEYNETTTLNSQLENQTSTPLLWDHADYGYCYPDVRRIWASNDDMAGISPLHGDYMLLKSINANGISWGGNQPGYYYKYNWWEWGRTLYDFTRLHGNGDYGTFLYVDASDESRTIAQMSFEADLCAGSELCFTGHIANMTNGQTNPQVMSTVYAVKENGARVRVVSFHSSNLKTITTDYTNATWYQIYGKVAIPANVDLTNVDHYEVDIDNYADNTQGADYCVDQLQFYTSNARLKVRQSRGLCGDDDIPLNIYVDAEDVDLMAGRTIFWRICDEDGNVLTDATLYNNGDKLYGQTDVPMTVPASIPDENHLGTSGYFTGSDGVLYFSLANRDFALQEGASYFISVYNLNEVAVQYESLWGKQSDECSVFSPIFVPKKMYLTAADPSNSGSDVTTVVVNCNTQTAEVNVQMKLHMPDDTQVTGFKEYTGVHFDYFKGTEEEFNDYYYDYGNDDKQYLREALLNFRGKTGSTYSDPPATAYQGSAYNSSSDLPNDYKAVNSQRYYNVIKQAMDAGLLFLSSDPTMHLTIDATHTTICALPIEDHVTSDAVDYDICSPLEFTFKVDNSSGAPTLAIGFEDVDTYPETIRVIRVGKEQLDNMQRGSGYLLHIPVNSFKVNGTATPKQGTLRLLGDVELLAYNAKADQTTDDQITANINKVATFATDETVSSSKMYISVNFHGDGVTKPTFQEGFAYRMFFQFRDQNGSVTDCDGSTEFLLKVVPEFVTWTGGSGSNWNNDANWRRSTRSELYKDENVAGKKQNTATAGHPDGYDNNGEHALVNVVTTPATYVPMKFTYVTLPTGIHAPNLKNLTAGADGIYTNTGEDATARIQYDIMVRYTETTCQGGTNHTAVGGNVYDCEKFYGNWAKELYLKPAAELLNQQYLTYEKVWVEKELTSNTWSLMSTPLQNTYAGDMYVPYSTTEAQNGRQLSEAFQSISFSTAEDAAGFKYSRTLYPIYQKGWTQQGVKVYTKTNDIRHDWYSANIPGGVSTILNQWSHVYNDVQVPYSTWTAFAIRPHKKTQAATTLIRLPKADTSFDYYQWDNTSPADGKLTHNVAKTTTGKLLTDGTMNIAGVTHGVVYGSTARTAGSGTFNAQIASLQSSPSNYQLVGNPYLCSIAMDKFLAANTANLELAGSLAQPGYWTYTDNNTGAALTTGIIGPMQSFFVKAKEGATQIVFTPEMMVDGNSVAAPARRYDVLLSARNEHGSSVAAIQIGEETGSVETMFDSNLSDVPMVYTVAADGVAVTVNRISELAVVPFGVTCSSNEPVNVEWSMVNGTCPMVYVYDAQTGTTTTVGDGESVSVQPNEYGRYYLTRSSDLASELMDSKRWNAAHADGPWYTLDGLQLDAKPTAKGLYINAGRIVVVK